MRNSFQCPKCHSRAVIEVIGSSMNQQTKIPLTKWSFKNATLDRYICADCGYTEEFVQLTKNFKSWARKNLVSRPPKADDGFV